MKKPMFLTVVLLSLVLVASLVRAEEDLDFSDETTRLSYSLGYRIGGGFKRQGMEMDPEAAVQGVRDALTAAEPQMSEEEMTATLAEFKRKTIAEARSKQKEQAEKTRREGLAFLEQNRGKEDVETTASGLQYKVIQAGSGRSPGPTDTVTVNYRGTLIGGQVFDSSYKRGKPATFRLDQVIKGWTEGLQLMKEGAKYELFIPPDLAYGKKGRMADQTLIFEVELLSVGEVNAEEGRSKGQGKPSAP